MYSFYKIRVTKNSGGFNDIRWQLIIDFLLMGGREEREESTYVKKSKEKRKYNYEFLRARGHVMLDEPATDNGRSRKINRYINKGYFRDKVFSMVAGERAFSLSRRAPQLGVQHLSVTRYA